MRRVLSFKRLTQTGAVVVSMTMAACAKQPPRVVAEPPVALEVPVPPPRVLAPVPPAETPVVQAEPPAEPRPPARPRAPRPSTAESKTAATGRPEAATDVAAAPSTDVQKPDDGVTPAPTLRTPQIANDSEADRKVRDALGRALRGLEDINRAVLSADARAQYDTARRFVDQATDALKARNYMFAAYLADKAEQLARGLAGR